MPIRTTTILTLSVEREELAGRAEQSETRRPRR
jgi:hypothetical protein